MSLARVAPLLVLLAAAGCGGSDRKPAPTVPTVAKPTPTVASPTPTLAAPVPSPPARPSFTIPAGSGHLAAMAPIRGFTIRDKPGGRVIKHLRPVTEWGSPTVVWATQRRGNWIGVVTTALPNNTIGWIDVRHDRPRMWRARTSLRADLSDGTLEVHRGGRLVRTIPVTIGGPDSPTPTGRFTVTDKLIPDESVAYYGCCLLALSGHQPKLRPGWAGGNRIAIHGGPSGERGLSPSAGCLRASNPDLEWRMKRIAVGTPVVISA